MAVTEALSLLFAWWAAQLRRAAGLGGSGHSLAMNQFNPLAFVTHGITRPATRPSRSPATQR
jgi:hypothetical protein